MNWRKLLEIVGPHVFLSQCAYHFIWIAAAALSDPYCSWGNPTC